MLRETESYGHRLFARLGLAEKNLQEATLQVDNTTQTRRHNTITKQLSSD